MDSAAWMNRRTALKRAGALAEAFAQSKRLGHSLSPRCAPALPSSRLTSSLIFLIFLLCRRRITAPTCNSRRLRCTPFFWLRALERRPTRADQAEMNRALGVLEHHYPWARRTW